MSGPPPGAGAGAPTFAALSREECLAVLDRHAVGRLAYAFRDRVDIQPIHYVHADGWLYGRTSEGSKLDTVAHNRWVAFEVDEVRGVFDWTSVVVHGAFYRLEPDAPAAAERAHAERAVSLLEHLVPDTLGPGDPVPFRTALFRVHVDEVSGRRAVPVR